MREEVPTPRSGRWSQYEESLTSGGRDLLPHHVPARLEAEVHEEVPLAALEHVAKLLRVQELGRHVVDVKQGVARLGGLRPLGAGHVALGRGPEAAEARRPPRVQLVRV